MAGNNGRTEPEDRPRNDHQATSATSRRNAVGVSFRASLAARHPKAIEGKTTRKRARFDCGYGQAFKLSTVHHRCVVVGIAIGWMVDHLAGHHLRG